MNPNRVGTPTAASPIRPLDRRGGLAFAVGAGLIAALAVSVFALQLSSEPHFADESAYLSQTYYFDLWAQGRTNAVDWLEYPAYDLPPLPKYLIGAALKLGGYSTHGPAAARQWYANTSSRFGPPGALQVARWPSVLLGALGCVAVFGLGSLIRDRRVGAVAAVLLMLNPLYRLHARRAMSDVPAEAFLLVALALALLNWRRLLAGERGVATWLAIVAAGFSAGLAPLAKLNGALAMLVIMGWAVLAVALPHRTVARKLTVVIAVAVMGIVAVLTFVALNPFLTAHPSHVPPQFASVDAKNLVQRGAMLVTHRMSVSRGQQALFRKDALTDPGAKLTAIAVQGFGRFGPFGPRHSDSTRRFDLAQDWGVLIWLPWVLLGIVWGFRLGRHQFQSGAPPTGWALLVQSGVTFLIVATYLPLAWDRYYLSLQAPAALLAAGVAVAAVERPSRRLFSNGGRT